MVHRTTPAMPLSPKPLPRQASGENNSPRRFKIYFQDDAVRQRSQDAVQHLLTTAASSDASSTSALLAKKALKYRKVLDRMSGVDVTAPEFDASKFMGVDWCKTHNLKAHCAHSQ